MTKIIKLKQTFKSRVKNLIAFTLTLLLIVISLPIQAHAETEAENEFMGKLIMQGYSFQQAWDEMFEVMRGKSGPYGTGGIDGIDPYSSKSASSGKTSSSSSTPKHTHTWTETVTKEASCKETGILTLTCSCGETKEETIPLTDHSYKLENETPATCIAYRTQTFKCVVCEAEYTQTFEEEGYGDHTYLLMEDSIPTTCEAPGSNHYSCTTCQDEYWEEIPSLGHTENPNHEIIPATFWKDGKETTKCLTCEKVIAEQILPSKGGIYRYILPTIATLIIITVAILLIIISKKKSKESK